MGALVVLGLVVVGGWGVAVAWIGMRLRRRLDTKVDVLWAEIQHHQSLTQQHTRTLSALRQVLEQGRVVGTRAGIVEDKPC